jgi:transposase
MKRYTKRVREGMTIYVGIDMHKQAWYVTIVDETDEIWHGNIPGEWEALRAILDRYRGCRMCAVYEAGCFGFRLFDRLTEYGAKCIVTPPSLVPMEYGNMVKTDRRDSRKLAYLLQKGMLKKVHVPTEEERSHRQVFRRRRQLVEDRVRTQHRIKSELRFFGVGIPDMSGPFSRTYMSNLRRLRLDNHFLEESFHHLLDEYEFLSNLIERQTRLIHEIAALKPYRDRVKLLTRIPGIGVLSAIEILVELQDVGRFQRPEQLAAYVGLTPSQYSTGEKVRMGHITKVGKSHLRATLIEASWRLVSRDEGVRSFYEQLRARVGAKRAIVAVARRLIIQIRKMLLTQTPYSGKAAA